MSNRITKVYTRTGDTGETGLVGGQRVPKDHIRLECYGTVDELMAALGAARMEFEGEKKRLRSSMAAADFASLLEFMQNRLFTLGGELATRTEDIHPQMPVITAEDSTFLERVCDAYNAPLEPLKDFVLPGGTRTSVALHVARTICRRAERHVIALSRHEPVRKQSVIFLNRFSDALFVLCRWINNAMSAQEVIWNRNLAPPPLPEAED